MNEYTQQAERDIVEKGYPSIPDNVRLGGTQRTSKKVVQSFIANGSTCVRRGLVLDFDYKHLGLGVYEFGFGKDQTSGE